MGPQIRARGLRVGSGGRGLVARFGPKSQVVLTLWVSGLAAASRVRWKRVRGNEMQSDVDDAARAGESVGLLQDEEAEEW